MAKASIITPTRDREAYLKLLHGIILQQTYSDWEWLIFDDSWKPSDFFKHIDDPRIHYYYQSKDLTIGKKRQELIAKASGEFILHFDDDDYYAPGYLERVVKELEESDFFHIHSWYCYDSRSQEFFYWSSDESSHHHFLLSPTTPACRVQWSENAHKKEEKRARLKMRQGYGFSYAYKKQLSQDCRFKNISMGEDYQFYKQVKNKGFRICSIPDEEGLAVHVIHHVNMSSVFPQYQIPQFLLPKIFPYGRDFFSQLPKEYGI